MITRKIGLVSNVKDVKIGELAQVGAALEKQVRRDFAAVWSVDALVSAFQKLEDMPIDYWPVILVGKIKDAAGYHEDEDGQPFALVEAGDAWPLTASHEVLEMLVDPWGKNMVAGPSLKEGQGRVRYLVEVCDPSEDEAFAYTVNGIQVSDFYTPSYFDPVAANGVRYSYSGAITKPREVLQGGYLSWQDPKTRNWWQCNWFGGKKPKIESLGKIDGRLNIRAMIDQKTTPKQIKAKQAVRAAKPSFKTWDEADSSAKARAASLRKIVARLAKK